MIQILENSQILELKRPLPNVKYDSGVYFLIKDNEVVYVGKSSTIINRICTHIKENKKQFDSYSFISIDDPHEVSLTEVYYIETLDPIYNKAINSSKLVSEVYTIVLNSKGIKFGRKINGK